ncbi:MAG: arylsulfatase [Planctomycetes bacterium]|nr:arylsulfatase [Planctomycetota bacterium]
MPLLAIAALLLSTTVADAVVAEPDDRPNIIFILADDLGYGDPLCYNPDSKIPTPNLDRLAAQGMRFTDAHSGSAVCTPTRYGILTGRYAWRTRLKRGVLWGVSPHLIDPKRTTVASFLRSHGYYTACIGKWHLGMDWSTLDGKPLSDASNEDVTKVDYDKPVTNGPNSVGFDSFFGIPASLDMLPYCYLKDDQVVAAPTDIIARSTGLRMWRGGPIAPGFEHIQVMPTLMDKAIEFLDEQAALDPARPFFLYLPLTAPHTPVVPTEEFIGASKAGPYGDFVVQVDASIGLVLDALKRNHQANNTLIIVTSDNGSTMTRKSTAQYEHQANHIYRGRKSDAWEGGHRVPFIARWPGVIAEGSTCQQTIWLGDLLATCAAIIGEELATDAGEDSVSLLPLLQGQRSEHIADRAVVHHGINGIFAIRLGPWKLILARGSGGWSLPEAKVPTDAPDGQLYNLERDPTEMTNLYDQYPEMVQQLTSILTQYKETGRSVAPPTDPKDD